MTDQCDRRTGVLIVTSMLQTGGVEGVVLSYARLLDRQKYRVALLCLTAGRAFEDARVIPDLQTYHIATQSRLRRFFAVWRVARDLRPQIVHNHACWYGLIAGRLVGARCVETVHNQYSWFTSSERIRYGLYARLADALIAVSEAVQAFTLDFFPGIRKNRFVVIHNGIDIEKFPAGPGDGSLREELGIARDELVVGFIGRLTQQKGVAYLLQGVAEARRAGHLLRLVLVGEGELQEPLKRTALELGLTDAIFTGYRQDIPRLLRMFNICVLPSLFEGLPIVVAEAMATGRPVIATRVSGTAEIMVDGVTGFLVEPGDSSLLCEKLVLLATRPDLRTMFGENARKRVTENFTESRMVRRTEELYDRLLAGSWH